MGKFKKPPEFIREYLSYDPETGIFTWIKRPNPNVPSGTRAGSVNPDTGYRLIHFKRVNYTCGRLAWFFAHGESPDRLIDHINGDRDDNRIANLRPATYLQNSANQKGWSRLDLPKGVSRIKSRKKPYCAKLRIGGAIRYVGYFATAEEAHAAYCRAAVEHFGEFARFE